MENLIEAIRNAVAQDASDEARATGALACRTILAALEAKPGDELVIEKPPAPGASQPAIGEMVSALRGLPVDQLLDLAIARMRAALPSGTQAPRVEPVKFRIVQLPSPKR